MKGNVTLANVTKAITIINEIAENTPDTMFATKQAMARTADFLSAFRQKMIDAQY